MKKDMKDKPSYSGGSLFLSVSGSLSSGAMCKDCGSFLNCFAFQSSPTSSISILALAMDD